LVITSSSDNYSESPQFAKNNAGFNLATPKLLAFKGNVSLLLFYQSIPLVFSSFKSSDNPKSHCTSLDD